MTTLKLLIKCCLKYWQASTLHFKEVKPGNKTL